MNRLQAVALLLQVVHLVPLVVQAPRVLPRNQAPVPLAAVQLRLHLAPRAPVVLQVRFHLNHKLKRNMQPQPTKH